MRKHIKWWKLIIWTLFIAGISILITVSVITYYHPRAQAESYCNEIGWKWQAYGCHEASDIFCTVDKQSGFHECKKRKFEECRDRCLEPDRQK